MSANNETRRIEREMEAGTVTEKVRWRSVLCVELLSSRLSIDSLMLNTYSASGRRTVHLATISSCAPAAVPQLRRVDTSPFFFDASANFYSLHVAQ